MSAQGNRGASGGGRRIVAFTKDWTDVPTCTTHILREMARTLPVLWIESIGTRRPSAAAPGDAGRVWRRIRKGLRRSVRPENLLRVLSPLLIPRADSAAARRLNGRLATWLIGRELAEMGDGPVEYWCFVPNAVDLLNADPGSRVIYFCVDDWSKFHNLDGGWLAAKESELLGRADVVFTPARYLENACRQRGATRVHYVPHGVEHARFATALDPSTVVPADVAGLPRPVVGFYGNIHPWIDFALIERLARARPGWTFVLIGGVFCDVSRLEAVSNVRVLGRREHTDLPAYCRGFDVAFIPYDTGNPRMESVNPVKTKELLAAGVPVVACDIPELRGYGSDVRLCRRDDEWLAALAEQAARTDRREISDRVRGEDWATKVAWMRSVVEGLG